MTFYMRCKTKKEFKIYKNSKSCFISKIKNMNYRFLIIKIKKAKLKIISKFKIFMMIK